MHLKSNFHCLFFCSSTPLQLNLLLMASSITFTVQGGPGAKVNLALLSWCTLVVKTHMEWMLVTSSGRWVWSTV